jgi:3-phenylpropionate/trans-cinnamate dioxygenase ferredoxin reductase subunit
MTTEGEHVVVVGAGQAAGDLVAALRSGGSTVPITLVGDEPHVPYMRPALSKGYLAGAVSFEDLFVRPAALYPQLGVELRCGARVVGIDRTSRSVDLMDGTRLPYSTLVLATGGRARELPLFAGEPASNVFTLRSLADVDALRPALTEGQHLLVVGGGYIGLEIGAVARRLGLRVTVVEAADRLLSRVAAAATSDFFQEVHRREGVEVLCGRTVASTRKTAAGVVEAVTLSDGLEMAVDLVLVGVGIVPNTELADAAGLAVDDGVLVDEFMRTSDPRVLAIGDVARFPCAGTPTGSRRLESTPNASEQAEVAASVILGRARPLEAEPWFWSDQFDVKLQVVGVFYPTDATVVRTSRAEDGKLAVFHVRDGVVRAADIAGSPRDFALARKLVAQRAVVDTEALADAAVPLATLVARRTARSLVTTVVDAR